MPESAFGYFAGCRGAGCNLRGAGCNLRGAGQGLWGAGCEMLSLIFRTSNLSVKPLFCSRCHDSLTQKCLSHVFCVILCELTRIRCPAPCKPCPAQPVNYTL